MISENLHDVRTEDRNLRVVIDDSVVREAFLTLRESMR